MIQVTPSPEERLQSRELYFKQMAKPEGRLYTHPLLSGWRIKAGLPEWPADEEEEKAKVDKLKAALETDEQGPVPAQAQTEQFDSLLGINAKKKMRCAVCTMPLSDEDIQANQLTCVRCRPADSQGSGQTMAQDPESGEAPPAYSEGAEGAEDQPPPDLPAQTSDPQRCTALFAVASFLLAVLVMVGLKKACSFRRHVWGLQESLMDD